MHLSVHRLGLAAATLTAIATVGVALALDGYVSSHRAASSGAAVPAVSATSAPIPAASLPPELVYVRPAPSPQVIRVTQTAPPAAPKVVHVTVPGTGGEGAEGADGGEHDGGGD